jgi:site-specific recombinase XerD
MANDQYWAPTSPQSPLAQGIKAWEIYLRDQGKSIYTIRSFIGDLLLLGSFLGVKQPLEKITTNDLNQFLHWLQRERGVPCSAKSLARRVTSIKSFFRWLVSRGMLSIDPAEQIVQHSVISPVPEVLTSVEQAAVRSITVKQAQQKRSDSRPQALFDLLLQTGIKKGECLSISVNHIDLDAPQGPILFIRYSNPANRYKERKLPLTPEWVTVLRDYLDQYRPMDKLFPWSPRRLEYLLEELGKEAGLQKHLSFDMCRWTCALNDWKSGMDHEKIRQKLGTSKIQWREISMKLCKLAEQ